MRNILLLTSTITPPAGVPGLNRTNPLDRLADYSQALDFYCRLPASFIPSIVFIENSGSDISSLREIARKNGAGDRIEWISFNGLDHSPRHGRGYGEFKLLDYAMSHSHTLQSAADEDRLWKVTGRYRIINLLDLIRTAPPAFDLYLDLRDRPMPWVDLRVFCATKGGYSKLLQGIYSRLREDHIHMSPEKYLRPYIGELAKSHPIETYFRREPKVDGIRGLDSQNYSQGMNLVKYWVRATSRRVRTLVPLEK